ncbi:hypothetical protein DFS34DRAFT_628687 [Phlyctochytrium arcticum]|nr:hypothetical protein DFS34DRAFT_628687 [Phlyctochytrium arcticum]
MKSSILGAAALTLSLASTVAAHGFIVGPGVIGPGQEGSVRNYKKINIDIDSLRNPVGRGNSSICRGAPASAPVPITLNNGQDFTVTLAMSTGAAHIGPCSIEVRDADNLSAPGAVITNLWSKNGCAVPPHNTAYTGNDKSSASGQCPGKQPKGLVTNDMCLSTWTFKVENADKIKCNRCVLRWYWEGWHMGGPGNPEVYENCIDVTISGKGGESAPAPAPLQPTKGSATTVTQATSVPKKETATAKPVDKETANAKPVDKDIPIYYANKDPAPPAAASAPAPAAAKPTHPVVYSGASHLAPASLVAGVVAAAAALF